MIEAISNVMAVKLFANLPQEISNVDKDIHQVVKNDRKLQWKNLKVNFAQGTGVTILIGTMLSSLIYGRLHGTVSPARAFLKQAPILLLDEATSALDSIAEGYIKESLHDLMLNKTTIVIAHRLSTLKDMDRILVFVDWEIVEDGSLEKLLQNTAGHFYKLWNSQAEGFIAPDAPAF
jgi:ABC-type transporter Mla maintaining outer membrane lipid asymmetry ATPase subunit MlaF